MSTAVVVCSVFAALVWGTTRSAVLWTQRDRVRRLGWRTVDFTDPASKRSPLTVTARAGLCEPVDVGS